MWSLPDPDRPALTPAAGDRHRQAERPECVGRTGRWRSAVDEGLEERLELAPEGDLEAVGEVLVVIGLEPELP